MGYAVKLKGHFAAFLSVDFLLFSVFHALDFSMVNLPTQDFTHHIQGVFLLLLVTVYLRVLLHLVAPSIQFRTLLIVSLLSICNPLIYNLSYPITN